MIQNNKINDNESITLFNLMNGFNKPPSKDQIATLISKKELMKQCKKLPKPYIWNP